MRRRTVLGLGLGVGAIGIIGLKPSDNGAAYNPYFTALNQSLKQQGKGIPILVIDKKQLIQNCVNLKKTVAKKKHLRLVTKSLPSLNLLKLIMQEMSTNSLMAFHQPHLTQLANEFPNSDILLGKPMPINAVAEFYRQHKNEKFNPSKQLQWLVDSIERVHEYAAFAQSQKIKLLINLEIDVGLHRGGFQSLEDFTDALKLLDQYSTYLRCSGLMGYDAHVGKIPSVLASRQESYEQACARYTEFKKILLAHNPTQTFTFNGAGSPTIRLHDQHSPVEDLAVGSAFLKPSDFNTDLLLDIECAAWIATPVLKVLNDTTIPGIEKARGLFSAWDKNQQRSYFIYGGLWMANYESPKGLQDNDIYGKSSNQAIVNGSKKTLLAVNDYIFLRPTQSEGVLLEFGDIAVYEDGNISEWWPVFSA
jgi:D-serine deaminase-like pyridoxal phosphate-dependent protein